MPTKDDQWIINNDTGTTSHNLPNSFTSNKYLDYLIYWTQIFYWWSTWHINKNPQYKVFDRNTWFWNYRKLKSKPNTRFKYKFNGNKLTSERSLFFGSSLATSGGRTTCLHIIIQTPSIFKSIQIQEKIKQINTIPIPVLISIIKVFLRVLDLTHLQRS